MCIVHQIRNSLRYVASKNHKAFMVDLKKHTKPQPWVKLRVHWTRWKGGGVITTPSSFNPGGQSGRIFRLTSNTQPIRRVIYTTNSVEAVHRQFRKLTKTKGGFPNDMSVLKLLYLGIQNASKRWTMPIRNWNLTLSQLAIHFEGRLDAALDL